MAQRKTTKTVAKTEPKAIPNAKDLEIEELKQQLQNLQSEFDSQCLKLGATQSKLKDFQFKNEQLKQELAEEKEKNEKRDHVVTIRITKTAFENLSKYATQESYKTVSNLISEIVCKVSYTDRTIRHALHPDYVGSLEPSPVELQNFRLEDQHQGDPV